MTDSPADDPGSEQIRFGMLSNEDPSSTERMEKYTGEVGWDYLRPHFESGALLYVDPSLSLVEVGRAFVDDESSKVADWRASGDLVTPSAPHAEYWESSRTVFRALVVSPFVLAQPVPDREEA